MINIGLAIFFFFLGSIDAFDARDTWIFWGWVNMAIGAVLVIAGAVRDR